MQRRFKLVLSLFCLLSLILFIFLRHQQGPRYNGRPLSDWIEVITESKRMDNELTEEQVEEATAAIRHIGAKGIPFLLKRIRYSESESRRNRTDFLFKVPFFGESLGNASVKPGYDAYAAADIFQILGPQAKDAIPELAEMMNTSEDWEIVERAAFCLVSIGDDALPTLSVALKNPDSEACRKVAGWLADDRFEFSTNIIFIIPSLIACSTNEDWILAQHAVAALGRIPYEPEIVIPALRNASHSDNIEAKREAITALRRRGIDPMQNKTKRAAETR